MVLTATPTPAPVPLQIAGNEWVIAVIGVSLLAILFFIGFFFFSGKYFDKNKNGYPALTAKEKEQEKRLQ